MTEIEIQSQTLSIITGPTTTLEAQSPHTVVIEGPIPTISVHGPITEIHDATPARLIETTTRDQVTVEGRGAQGPQGLPGDIANVIRTYTAGSDLGGGRIVRLASVLEYADANDITHANSVLGLTLGAIVAGAQGQVLVHGQHSDSAFNFTPGSALYLGSQGLINQTSPTTGFSITVGFAVNANTVFIDIDRPIVLQEN